MDIDDKSKILRLELRLELAEEKARMDLWHFRALWFMWVVTLAALIGAVSR